MSTVATMAPSPAPHDRVSFNNHDVANPSQHSSPPSTRASTSATSQLAVRRDSDSPKASTEGKKSSPNGSRNNTAPKIIVKKEPSSPEIPASSRHRPRKLDLSKHTSVTNPSTARPSTGQLTSRESGGLGIQDVGLACLSPGFVTQDPTMRNQLARSISVREQQRHIIESRLQQTAKPENAPQETPKHTDASGGISAFGTKTPGTSRRKAPPGLSIVAPSHEQFANERVIQSAPLNHSFTGRHQPQPLTRHVANQPSNLSNTSHIHHVPATQTVNRLPPISDVFGVSEGLGIHRPQNTERDDRGMNGPRTANFFPSNGNSSREHNSDNNSSHSNNRPTFPSPGHRGEHTAPHSARHRSAEEAQAELAGGRSELLPKLVHYGGHQPPTPPSPPSMRAMERGGEFRVREEGFLSRSGGASGGRRRTRAEYEDGESPPLGHGPSAHRRAGPFGEGRDSPEAQARKKAEFIGLCARAWDLFHS